MTAEQQTTKLSQYIIENYSYDIIDGGVADVAIKVMERQKEAILTAMLELGVPGEDTPAPVANAQEILEGAYDDARRFTGLTPTQFLPEIFTRVREQLEADQERWGNVWLERPFAGQAKRIWERYADYFDRHFSTFYPVPWTKIIGGAVICMIRELHPEMFPKTWDDPEAKSVRGNQ